MVNIIKIWFDGARRFGRGWRRCRLFGEGVLILLLAMMLGTCVIPVTRFLVIALAVICLIIATRKFWLSVRMPKIAVLAGLCLAANNIWAYAPYEMSDYERQRIENEERVRAHARDRMRKEQEFLEHVAAMPAGPGVPSNWGEMPGVSQADEQAKALGAAILLGALCEQAKKEQEQQAARERQKEMAKQENQSQPKASERQACTQPEREDEESTGAGVWLVLVLLGGVGVYVIYGELKHRSESRGKPLPRLRRPNIVCPHCGCVYEYDPELIGVTVQCGSCNKEFVAQKPV